MKKQIEKVDYVADILQIWYDSMAKHGLLVQPKCSTLLATILSEYNVIPKHTVRDIWKEAMTINGGEFTKWYDSLNAAEKLQYEEGRQKASGMYDPRNKQLLKG
tara:strand:+ start:69 stop:380 length:312 start_codon:yes stop_codon:yes gene_type:complete